MAIDRPGVQSMSGGGNLVAQTAPNMADTEFEEFKQFFDKLPQYIKAPVHSYTLVHDISPEDDDEEELEATEDHEADRSEQPLQEQKKAAANALSNNNNNNSPVMSRGLSLDERTTPTFHSGSDMIFSSMAMEASSSVRNAPNGSPKKDMVSPKPPWPRPNGERRRRKLPEIPKDKKPSSILAFQQPSLADELTEAVREENTHRSNASESVHFAVGNPVRPILVLRCHGYLRDEDSSPDSERFQSTDVDSGNSTAHSPDLIKSCSPQVTLTGSSTGSLSPSPSTPCIPFTHLELLEATHRGLHRFIPRHHDEIEIEIGDPIYVQKEADDLWCEGVNLRTARAGIFPSAYTVDVDYSDFDPSATKTKKERYLLSYLGSVETLCHKGNHVLCQAVRKIVGQKGFALHHLPHPCILEISDQGIRMVDKSKPAPNHVPCHDYFYSLKNVSFCGFHPRDHRYFGFVTKHPHQQRFACHIFMGEESTRPVAEAVGRAFQRFYQKFIETAYPIEEFYIE